MIASIFRRFGSEVTIIELLPGLKAAMAPGGQLVLSGIIAEQEASVTAAAMAQNLSLVDRRFEEDWVVLVVKPII